MAALQPPRVHPPHRPTSHLRPTLGMVHQLGRNPASEHLQRPRLRRRLLHLPTLLWPCCSPHGSPAHLSLTRLLREPVRTTSAGRACPHLQRPSRHKADRTPCALRGRPGPQRAQRRPPARVPHILPTPVPVPGITAIPRIRVSPVPTPAHLLGPVVSPLPGRQVRRPVRCQLLHPHHAQDGHARSRSGT